MNIIWFLLPLALLMGFGFLAAFFWAVKSGQFDDVATPPQRVLLKEEGEQSLNDRDEDKPMA